MRYHNTLKLALAAVVVVAVAAALLASAAAPTAEQPSEYQLPRLFDFTAYRETFNKVYGSIVEELARKKFMLARALRAFVSGIKYKHGQLNYHLALNHLSDRSPEELDRMDNPQIGAQLFSRLPTLVTTSASTNELEVVPEVNATVEVILENIRSIGLRSSGQQDHQLELIETPRNDWPRGLEAKTEEPNPLSNNPYYHQEPGVVMGGRRAKAVRQIQWHYLEPRPGLDGASCLAYFRKLATDFSAIFKRKKDKSVGDETRATATNKSAEKLPDEVFFDHRNSNCLFPTRDQGYCGSCYAFVGVALAEWLYCSQTGGHRVAFSEQYMVDCGEPVGLNGCFGGGTLFGIGDFIHNYGLELQRDYPYVGYQDECPYGPDTEPQTMGYIRMRLGAGTLIPVTSFEEYLRYSPIVVAINRAPGFKEYGRGVFSGSGCEGQGVHAVLLVGHGRENGEEYWLIRNSYRPYWGEQGHMKLAKRSSCIEPPLGAVYGTDDAFSYSGIKISKTPATATKAP